MRLRAFFYLFLVLAAIPLLGAEDVVKSLNAGAASSALDLKKVFVSAPIIYSLLFGLSIVSFIVWLYSLLTLRQKDLMPKEFVQQVREQLTEKRFEAALVTCKEDGSFSSSIIASGITARNHGTHLVRETMEAEGKRRGVTLWQRLSLLNEIAMLSPMLGLLGTVVGIFYAFYDSNRSTESINAVFDGLGVAVGTTVAGLIVAIMALSFYTILRYRLVRALTSVEHEALSLIPLMEIDASKRS